MGNSPSAVLKSGKTCNHPSIEAHLSIFHERNFVKKTLSNVEESENRGHLMTRYVSFSVHVPLASSETPVLDPPMAEAWRTVFFTNS